jgi:T5SS/PEP-CTERM-associated repeat protein
MRYPVHAARTVAAILLVACTVLSAGVAAASEFEWTSAVSGNYIDAAKWTRTSGVTSAPPVAGDTANFNELGPYNITFSASAASNTLNVTAGNVTFLGTGAVRTYALAIAANVNSGSVLTLGTSLLNPLNLTVNGVLDVESNATLNVKYGSVVGPNQLFVGVYGGTVNSVLVDGSGLGCSAGGYLGFNGFTGNLTYQNSSAGIWGGTLYMAESSGGGTGNLTVQSSSNITLGAISAATSDAPGAAATITVSGTGSIITQSGASTLTLGATTNGSAALNINNGAFYTGTGLTTVNATGAVNVTGTGVFHPKGDVTVAGGAINVAPTASFTWDSSRTLNVNGGGQVVLNQNYSLPTGATVNVTDTGSKLDLGLSGNLVISNGAQVNVTAGGDLAGGQYVDIGTGGNGALTVDGAGSSATAGGISSWWGKNGSTATVAFRNGATGSFTSRIDLAADSNTGTSANLTVASGAHLDVYDVYIGAQGGSSSASVTVDGTASSITQGAGSWLNVGAETGYGYLSIANGATYTVPDNGYTSLNKTGTISIDNGTAHLGTLTNNGGRIYFYRGYLGFTGDFLVGIGGVMGSNVGLGSTQRMVVNGDTTVGESAILGLNGGTFWTNGFNPSAGTFRFESGTFGVGMSGVGEFDLIAIGPNVTVNPNCYFIVSNKAVLDGLQRLTVNGGRFQAQRLDNAGAISVDSGGELSIPTTSTNQASGSIVIGRNSSAYAGDAMSNIGEILLDGGSAAFTGPGGITNTGLLRGDGKVANPLSNAAAGEIRAEAGKRLKLEGSLAPNAGLISLQGGTVEFTQALTNSATGFITGRGTLSVGGAGLTNNGNMAFSGGFTDVYGDVTNGASAKIVTSGGGTTTFYDDVNAITGSQMRVSPGCSVVFLGSYSGGSTGGGTVYMEGDLRPGHSPGAVEFEGDLVMGSGAALVAELAGTTAGSQYDVVDVGGSLALGGTLDVELLYGFQPQAGQTFDILNFDPASLSGEFAAIDLPDLGGGLAWDTSNLYTTGSIGVVPEPATLALAALGACGLLRRRTKL